MNGTVSALSMGCMVISAVLSFAIPATLYLLFRKRYGASGNAFWIGCATFVVFALVLESAMHRLVLGSAAGETIQKNIWLYALYGGLAAGVFEETGRWLAFRFALKKQRGDDQTALMYGAGHGGTEAALLLGLTMISNLVLSVLMNTGAIDSVLRTVPAEALEQVQSQLAALAAARPAELLLGVVERIIAVMLHLSLSVLVWFSVKRRRAGLYLLAVLLHAAVDGAVVLLAKALPPLAVEALLAVMTAVAAWIAHTVWRNNQTEST